MIKAVQSVLGKYLTFSGRATRPEYWYWILALAIFMVVLRLIDGFVIAPLLGFEVNQEESGQPISLLASLALFLPNLSVGIRRLHDTGRSGWWLLISLIPVIGFFVLLYFFVQPSDTGSNDYGEPDPI